MDNKRPIKQQRSEAKIREDRLKLSLKANMVKRKVQTRARAADKDKEKKE
jgi:hypothetical protein|tara:strand:- start:699 stop:848 length:150 start_codon:yes stop_codon:yes gene_type:complete